MELVESGRGRERRGLRFSQQHGWLRGCTRLDWKEGCGWGAGSCCHNLVQELKRGRCQTDRMG